MSAELILKFLRRTEEQWQKIYPDCHRNMVQRENAIKAKESSIEYQQVIKVERFNFTKHWQY